MKFVVLGYGKIGRAIVHDLSKNPLKVPVEVYDPFCSEADLPSGVRLIKSDPFSQIEEQKVFDHENVIVSALPAPLRERLFRAAANNGSRLVDVTFGNDDPYKYLPKQQNGRFVIIPDCGLAPGLSNLLVGGLSVYFDELEDVRIYVGGIPERPVPPLDYKITFSAESVIDEYVNPARIIENGQVITKEALSDIEEFVSEDAEGAFEAFLTDGLRTLLHFSKRPKNMFEKTIRYRGHAEKIKVLRDLGFLDSSEIVSGKGAVIPRKITETLFDRKLRNQNVGDIVLLKVKLTGTRHGKKTEKSASLKYVSPANSLFSGMAITTGYTASVTAQFLMDGTIKAGGLLPIEDIATEKGMLDRYVKELMARGIALKIS
ncbi:MAG: saccharopine dehydrogenase C-terminal domain-containing protein [Thermoplasmataceae archaeon]